MFGSVVPQTASDPKATLKSTHPHVSFAPKLGHSFRPAHVVCVEALPKTRNAKIMRRMIRAAWIGDDPGDTSALENPEAVDAIRKAVRQTAS